MLPDLSVKRILDAGCGNGWFAANLAKAGYRVVAIDVSTKAVDIARQTYPQIEFHCSPLDQNGWPFEDASFDAIVSTEVIEHIYDVERMFSEMARVLCPGGYVMLTTPYHGLLKNLAISILDFEGHFDVRAGHIRFFTNKSLTELLRDYGFEPFLWRYIGRIRPLAKSVFVVAQRNSDS